MKQQYPRDTAPLTLRVQRVTNINFPLNNIYTQSREKVVRIDQIIT